MIEENCEISVCVLSYNHEKYIRECLDSILAQKTKFVFEILIHDDASTDGTQKIIQEYQKVYPERIRVIIEEENQFQNGCKAVLFEKVFPKVRGRYIALCESDDYWCEINKLQEQYDALENNKDCNICTTETTVINENGHKTGVVIPQRYVAPGIIPGTQMLNYISYNDTHLFHTSSMMFRSAVFKKIEYKLPRFMTVSYTGDRAIILYLATCGNLFFIKQKMSCYRIMSIGSWSSKVSASKIAHYNSDLDIREMAKAFNQYTSSKYSQQMHHYITIINFRIYLYERNYRKVCSARYKELFLKLSFKERLYYSVCSKFPMIDKIYCRLKNKTGCRLNDNN